MAVSCSVFNVAVIRTHSIKLLKYLLVDHVSSSCILDVDAFGLLVSLVFSTPSLYVKEDKTEPIMALTSPTGGLFDKHFVNMVLVFHLTQVSHCLLLDQTGRYSFFSDHPNQRVRSQGGARRDGDRHPAFSRRCRCGIFK